MSAIHQIYCTHCTYGSSALERREGGLEHRTLGYSARAGSLEAPELRKVYRLFERYLYYYLPRDTPAEEKLMLTAATAPRRLVYLPSAGGLQVVGQVCYRPTDSEGRPGSYFAHVLVRDDAAGGARWPALTCLRLWQAPGWTEEDSPNIPFLLPALKSVDGMFQGSRAVVGDRVLRSFLTTEPGGAFDDPGHVIPPRLRQASAQQRQNLFTLALDAFLDACLTRHEPLLFVAEPDLAALLFYGLLRLLPDGPMREDVSFSTFEPNPDAICTTLAATLFYDPDANRSPPEALGARGPVINTFTLGSTSVGAAGGVPARVANPPAARPYASTLVARLVQKDWPAVEIMLGDVRACNCSSGEELQQVVAADRLLRALLEPPTTRAPTPATPLPQPGEATSTWRRAPLMARYMRQVLCRKLATADPAVMLRSLSGTASHMALLELLASSAAEHPEARKAVEFLLRSLPDGLLAPVLALDSLTIDDKLAALTRQLAAGGGLPPDCCWLWDHWAAGSSAPPVVALPRLIDVLARLEPPALGNFCRTVPPAQLALFYSALKDAFAGRQPFWNRLTAGVAALEPAAVVKLYGKLGPAMFANYPAAEPALGGKLHRLLDGLHDQTAEFSLQLDLLLAGQDLLPDAADRQRALAWSQCRQAILDLGRLQAQHAGWRRDRPLAQMDAAGARMVEAAQSAMPSELVEDDPSGSGKQQRLQAIGQCLLGEPLLPATEWHHAALWKKAGWYFERGKWPGVPLASLRPKAHAQRRWRIQLAAAATALAILLATLFVLLVTHGDGTTRAGAAGRLSASVGRSGADKLPVPPVATDKPAGVTGGLSASAGGTPAGKLPAPPVATDKPAAATGGLSASAGGTPADKLPAPPVATDKPATATGKPPPGATGSLSASAGGTPAGKPPVAPIETAKREPPLSAEERWRRDAQRFAEEHDGVLVEQPMTKGLATISNLDGLTPIPFGAERPFLGPGKIRAGSESYYFGNGFHGSPAAKFHEIPGLAKELGVNSVTVVLEPVDKNYRLVLHWEPLSVVDANTEAEVTKLRKLQEAIKECLPLIGAHISSEKERAEAQKTLMQLVGVEPPVAPKRDDPRFVHDAQAWDEALDTYRQECRKLLSKLPTLGQHRSLALGYQIDRVYRNALIEHSKRIDADLRSRVTQISAVLYRSIGKVEIPAAAATQSDRLAEIGGQFDETAEDAPAPGFIAQVKPRIVADPHGIPMPPSTWAAQKLLVKCVFTPAGGQPIVKEGAVQFEPADIPPGTEKMSVRFRFFRQGIFDGEDPQLIAETQAFVLKTIRPRQQYTITFRMSEEGLRALRDPNTASRPANF